MELEIGSSIRLPNGVAGEVVIGVCNTAAECVAITHLQGLRW